MSDDAEALRVRAHPAWRELYQWAKVWEYGVKFSHADVGSILDLEPQTSGYYAAVSRCNKELIKKENRCLVNELDKGYRVLKADEFVGEGKRQLDFAAKRVDHAYNVVMATPTALLDDDAKTKWNGASEQLVRIRGFMLVERHALKALVSGSKDNKLELATDVPRKL